MLPVSSLTLAGFATIFDVFFSVSRLIIIIIALHSATSLPQSTIGESSSLPRVQQDEH
jgi:hypothetical protein